MKLINKFTIWYFAVTTLVLLVGGFLVFYLAEKEIREEEERRLITLMEEAVTYVERFEHSDKALYIGITPT